VIYDIVGCGAVVRTYHVPILRDLARRRLIAVHGCFDLDAAAAATVAATLGARRHGGADEPPSPEADAVLVATPPRSHAAVARRYLAAGKHVLVEKPLVESAEDARDLVRQAQEVGRRILVAHFRRFYPSLRTARRFLATGGLGRLRRVEATEGFRWDWPASSSYFLHDAHGGVLWDTGAHVVDMLLYALSLDEPGRELECQICELNKRPPREPSHEFRARLALRAPGVPELEARLRLSRGQALAGALKFYGDAGVLIVPTTLAPAATLLRGSERFELTGAEPGNAPLDGVGCFVLEHLEFLSACSTGEPSLLDADRFVALSGLLARLGGEDGRG